MVDLTSTTWLTVELIREYYNIRIRICQVVNIPSSGLVQRLLCRLRTLLANDIQSRKESSMSLSGSHQSSKPTAPQLATLLMLTPGIQTDEIECHGTDHLLHLHGWLSSTARLSASQPTYLLRNTGFNATAQAIVALIGFIAGLRSILRQKLRTLARRQGQF